MKAEKRLRLAGEAREFIEALLEVHESYLDGDFESGVEKMERVRERIDQHLEGIEEGLG